MTPAAVRTVLDTDALAAGFVGVARWSNRPGREVRAWRQGRFDLSVSAHILPERATAFAKPYFRRRHSRERVRRAEVSLRRRATVVAITVPVPGVAAHWQDDLVLATALSAGTDHLVAGGRAPRALDAYQGVANWSRRELLDPIGEDAT